MKYILLSLILLVGLPDVAFGQSKWEKFLKKVEKASKEAQKIDKQIQQLQKNARKESPVKVPHFKNISKADFIKGKYKKITRICKRSKSRYFKVHTSKNRKLFKRGEKIDQNSKK